MEWRDALAQAAARLAAVSDTPRLDAELLLAHAAGVSREALLLHGLAGVPEGFDGLVARRAGHEPLAYITGRRDFWTIELQVSPAVLIPRADSETLIEAAVAHFAGTAGPDRVLDLGTGSGALLLAALAEWPLATGVGVDCSAGAVAVARANAERLGLAARATVLEGDFSAATGRYDLVLCNPPYVPDGAKLMRDVACFEPAGALYSGPDGLDDHRRLSHLIGELIAPGGIACAEIGADQAKMATSLYVASGLRVDLRPDLAGRPRCLILRQA
jgi:release factor glutamine methyltransferase